MKCSQAKKLIMDYIDGELSGSRQKEIASHLKSCASCKRLEQSLRLSAIEPMRKAQMQKAPPEIWNNIKNAIAQKEEKAPSLSPAWPWRLGSFRIRKPVLAPAIAAITIVMFIFVFGKLMIRQNPVNSYIAEQMQFVSQLAQNDEDSYLGISDVDLNTTIEQYFM